MAVLELIEDQLRRNSLERITREAFISAADIIRTICIYMERTYVVSSRKPPLLELAERFYNERKARSIAHWRRIAPVVGRCAIFLKNVYTEVTFRPENRGAKRAREEFEAAATLQ